MRLIAGIKSCPRSSVGYTILNLGHRLSRMASLINVNDPLINAWLAIIAAAVAMIIPKMRNPSGIVAKNGFRNNSALGKEAMKSVFFNNSAFA